MRVAIVFVLVLGCGGDDDGGGEPDARVVTDPFVTRGMACTDIGLAWCQRGRACGLITSGEVQTCQGAFVQGCCGGPPNTCSEVSARMQSWVNTCVSAMAAWGCDAVANYVLPPVCLGG